MSLLVLGAFGLVGGLYWKSYRTTNPSRLLVLILLRVALITGILLCLFNPHLVHEIRSVQPSGLLLLVDTSRSMLEPDGAFTRLERAQHWWLGQKPGQAPEQIRAFDEKLYPLKSDEPWKASAGNGTSLAKCLEDVSTLMSDAPIGQVILVSDGRVTDGEDPLPAARALGARGIPVSTLTLGRTESKPSLRIETIAAPPLVGLKTPVRAVIAISAKGLTGKSAYVRILADHHVLAQQKVTLNEQGQSVELNFIPPENPSLQICDATLDLADSQPGSPHETLPFALRVGDRKLRVLYMEGSQPSEMVYLQRALQQGGTPMEVTMLHHEQHHNEHHPDRVDRNVDDGSSIYDVENPTHGYPRTLQALLDYDVIIWSDILKEAFNDEQMKMTARFVEEYGGGFLMIGGSTSYGIGGFDHTPIDAIIPVAMENEKRRFGELFQPVATPEGLNHPVLSLGATPEETREIWQTKSPRIYGFQAVVRPKPGATILLEHPTMRNEYGPFIILAVQEIGQGRTMAFTPDTTIEGGRDLEHIWGEALNPQLPISPSNCDTRYFRQFWNNAIRWLGARRLAAKSITFTVETSKRRVNPDETFSIHALCQSPVSSESASIHPPETVQVQVTDLATTAVIQSLPAHLRAETGDYEIKTRLPQSGRYLIDLANASQEGNLCAPAVVTCDSLDPELTDVRADPELMAELAKASGGRVLSEDSFDARILSSSADRSASSHIEFTRRSLWDRAEFLALLSSLLILEWILRRRWSFI